ncbi:WD repeat-containing protein 55 [Echinococcus granulosus]|nr:WD repeat-containing protein 55 [Echinococcus granulosus]
MLTLGRDENRLWTYKIMCDKVGDACHPSNMQLFIGIDGVSSLCFVPSIDKNLLMVGTTGGRVRILDCSRNTCKTLYQKRWHKSIRCLVVNPFSPTSCITASNQGCLKVHDIETKKRIGYFTGSGDSSPFSALVAVTNHRWVTGDDNGMIKIWDDRLKEGHCFTIKPNTNEMDADLCGTNDLAVGADPQGTLLAAVESGCLVTYSIRRRRLETISEPLGYSARSVCSIKNGSKVLLGTDEGVILMYNWGEFGSICDRFPVRTSRTRVDHRSGTKFFDEAGCPAVEKIVKVTENIVVIATDDGAISPMSILPNRMLTCLGWHTADEATGGGGDCMTLAVSPASTVVPLLASGLPLAPSLKFWSVEHLPAEAEAESAKVVTGEKMMTQRYGRDAKARVTSRGADRDREDFLSGLTERNGEGSKGEEEERSNDRESD